LSVLASFARDQLWKHYRYLGLRLDEFHIYCPRSSA